MKTSLLYIIIFFSVFESYTQNLVPNPSFEDTVNCIGPWNCCSIEIANPWFSANLATSDLFTGYISCGYSLSQALQIPKTGNAFAGLYGALGNSRDYIEIRLTDSLLNNHLYCVGFYFNKSELCGGAIDRLGAHLSIDTLYSSTTSSISVIPQIETTPGIILQDTSNWILLNGIYLASGGETFLTIGNFRNQSETIYQLVDSANFICQHAYYYIEDVFVIDCTVGLEEMDDLNIQIHPNPSTSQIKISLPNSNAFDLEIYDMSGKLVYKNQEQPGDDHVLISTIDFADGLYLLRYVQGVRSGSSKFIIQH